MKRFTDTDKWTKNKWFRLLNTDLKLFWLYLLDNCDFVGVWEVDLEFFSHNFGIQLTEAQILQTFKKQILPIKDGRKWWIIDFCNFQYGELKIENIKNKPHQRYIQELKKHRLWIDYTKTINSLEEKDKDKEEEIEEEKEDANQNQNPNPLLEVYDVDPVLSLERLQNECLADSKYLEQFLRAGFKLEVVSEWMGKFVEYNIVQGNELRKRGDFRMHFWNWLPKQNNCYQPPKKPTQPNQLKRKSHGTGS